MQFKVRYDYDGSIHESCKYFGYTITEICEQARYVYKTLDCVVWVVILDDDDKEWAVLPL